MKSSLPKMPNNAALILPYQDIWPKIHESAFVAPGAAVIGDVEIGEESGVWFNVTIRGDINIIRIGARTNIQDNAVIHVDRKKYGAFIGNDVTIGHAAVVHACTIEDGAFVGMNACVLDGAVVEAGAMVAAQALVTPGKRIPAGELWAGVPAKFMRKVSEEDRAEVVAGNQNYVMLAKNFREMMASLSSQS